MKISIGQTVWLTRFALTAGVIETTVTNWYETDNRRILVGLHGYNSAVSFRLGRDVHTDRAEALRTAKLMRGTKVASLRAQVDRLEKLEFL